jgi:hypothetical protein
MRPGRARAALLAPALLVACHTAPTPGPAVVAAQPLPPPGQAEPANAPGWRDAIEPSDADRLARLDSAWTAALAAARGAGFARTIAAEGPLLDPDAAVPRADPPPGPYRCRVIRFGAGRAFIAYPTYFCHVSVDGGELAFTKQTGSELPAGYIWKDGERRGVFLGAMMLGGESAPPAYGQVETRDLAGVVERVGPLRYRLVLPWTRGGATIDVIELIPYVQPAE